MKKQIQTTTNKQKIGRQFEDVFSKKYSVEKVPNSGAGIWYKMDAENSAFLFSLKATANKSFSLKREDLDELLLEAKGPGGLGGGIIPLLSICFVEEGEEPKASDPMLAVLPMDDLVMLLKERPEIFKLSKNELKYEEAKVPSLLRHKE